MAGLADRSGDMMRAVDKLDKIGPEKVGLPSGMTAAWRRSRWRDFGLYLHHREQ